MCVRHGVWVFMIGKRTSEKGDGGGRVYERERGERGGGGGRASERG